MAKKLHGAALAAHHARISGSHARPVHTTRTQTIVVRPSAAKPAKHHKGHRGKGQSSTKQLMGLVLGGFVMGFIDKGGLGMNIPTIPILGRAGTIAVAAHFFGKGKQGIVTDIRNGAAVVAAYEFGLKGSVSGDGGEAGL